MFDPIVLAPGIAIPGDELGVEYSRASGPGGQHVNKTETRVTLRFALGATRSLPEDVKARLLEKLASRLTKAGEILVSVDAHRDRSQNLREAYARLVALLKKAFVKPKPRKKTRPTRGSTERRLEEKRRRQGTKAGRKMGRQDDD